MDVYVQTDSKAAALVTRLLGPAAPRMAEQGATQLLMFFSSMAKYLDERRQVPTRCPTLGWRGDERIFPRLTPVNVPRGAA